MAFDFSFLNITFLLICWVINHFSWGTFIPVHGILLENADWFWKITQYYLQPHQPYHLPPWAFMVLLLFNAMVTLVKSCWSSTPVKRLLKVNWYFILIPRYTQMGTAQYINSFPFETLPYKKRVWLPSILPGYNFPSA